MPARLQKGFSEQMVFELAFCRMNCNLLYGEGQRKKFQFIGKTSAKLCSKLDIFIIKATYTMVSLECSVYVIFKGEFMCHAILKIV